MFKASATQVQSVQSPMAAAADNSDDEEEDESWRVKVYRLNAEGEWDDRGLGRARVVEDDVFAIRVEREEEKGVVLIRSPVVAASEAYQQQGENIITWDATEADVGTALSGTSGKTCIAMSFQEREGCEVVLEQVRAAQACLLRRRYKSGDEEVRAARGAAERQQVVLSHVLGARGGELCERLAAEPRPPTSWPRLPPVRSREAAQQWVWCLARAVACQGGRETYARALLADDAGLLREFGCFVSDAEDLDDVEALRALADAAKLVVLLNEPLLVEAILDSPRIYEQVLGALEYAADAMKKEDDAEVPPPWSSSSSPAASSPASSRCGVGVDSPAAASVGSCSAAEGLTAAEARRFPLRELALRKSKMRQVLPMTDEVLRARVAQHFRATVLRDAVSRPGLDDAQLSALQSLIFFNTNDILRRLHDETDYLRRVIEVVARPTDGRARRAAIQFLAEMTALARGAQVVVRDALYRYAVGRAGLYEAISAALGAEKADAPRCLEIVSAVLRVDPSSLRRHTIYYQASHPAPPAWCVRDEEEGNRTADEDDAPRATRIEEINNNKPCESLLFRLCALCGDEDDDVSARACAAIRLCVDVETMDDAEREAFLGVFYDRHYVAWLASPLFKATGEARALVCEVLAYCVRSHAYRIKYFLLRHPIASRVVELARARSSAAQLAAVRFVRACAAARDDFFARYLVKNGAFGPIVALLVTKDDTLVASAVAELCEFVRSANLKALVDHLVQCHADKFANSKTHASLLGALETRLAQNEDALERATRVETRASRVALERDRDEAYFEEDDDDDDDDDPHHHPSGGGLRDDDDDAAGGGPQFHPRTLDAASDDETAVPGPFCGNTASILRRKTVKKPHRFEIKLAHPNDEPPGKRPRHEGF